MRRLTLAFLFATLAACATQRPHSHPAVARMWHGRVPDARAAEYETYLRQEGIARLEKIPGNLGVDLFTRSRDGITEFLVISYWPSLEEIKAYAGSDIEKTHFLPRDREFLIDPEPNVRHFEIRLSDRK